MNRLTLIICFVLLVAGLNVSAQQKRWARHGYRKVETKTVDHDDPEKSGRLVELISRKGKVLESWEWNENNRLSKHTVNTYSKRKFERCIYARNDSLRSREIIEYDRKGRKIRQFFSDIRKGKDKETLTEFDKWGNKVTERIYKNGKLSLIKLYTYNKEGLLEKQVHTDGAGKIIYEKNYHFSR